MVPKIFVSTVTFVLMLLCKIFQLLALKFSTLFYIKHNIYKQHCFRVSNLDYRQRLSWRAYFHTYIYNMQSNISLLFLKVVISKVVIPESVISANGCLKWLQFQQHRLEQRQVGRDAESLTVGGGNYWEGLHLQLFLGQFGKRKSLMFRNLQFRDWNYLGVNYQSVFLSGAVVKQGFLLSPAYPPCRPSSPIASPKLCNPVSFSLSYLLCSIFYSSTIIFLPFLFLYLFLHILFFLISFLSPLFSLLQQVTFFHHLAHTLLVLKSDTVLLFAVQRCTVNL